MNKLLSTMKNRNCKRNIIQMKKQMREMTQKTGINSNARLSTFTLEKIRKIVPSEFILSEKNSSGSNNYDRINLNLLNQYLNKYSEKLSRCN